jgi:hypothetical protein
LAGGLALTGFSGDLPWQAGDPSAASSWAAFVQEAKDSGASETQLAALSDGKVTFAEYEDATHAYLDCLREAGMTVEGGDEVDPTGRLQYGYSPAESGLTVEQAEAIAGECYATHSEFADQAYQDALFD